MAKKGAIPWNKGLSKETDDRVKKYAKTNSIVKTGKISKKVKYSYNCDDWKLKCGTCDELIIYISRETYMNACRYNSKHPTKNRTCSKCRNYGCERKISPYINMVLEEKNKAISERHRQRWANYTQEERQIILDKMLFKITNRDEESKRKHYESVAEHNRKRLLNNDGSFKFKPAYNKETIPYIIDILNERFDTKFQHAESDFGEFKIYDKERQKFYYADAYCSKLKLWIEFDEYSKFKNDILKDEHIIKHYRIKEIFDVKIIRFRVSKNYKHNLIRWIKEYYNDLTQYGLNLYDKIQY